MHIYKCTNERTKTQEKKPYYNHRHKRKIIQQHVTKHDDTMIEPWSQFWVFFNFKSLSRHDTDCMMLSACCCTKSTREYTLKCKSLHTRFKGTLCL